jgi:hypothetical protein
VNDLYSNEENNEGGNLNPYNKSGITDISEDTVIKLNEDPTTFIPNWNGIDTAVLVGDRLNPYWSRNEEANATKTKNIVSKLLSDYANVMDSCAWYHPYRQGPSKYWGIHFKKSCIVNIAQVLFQLSPQRISESDAIKSAFLYFYVHEVFHFMNNIAGLVIEITRQEKNIYQKYSRNVYGRNFPNVLEESLANEFLFSNSRFCRISRVLLKPMLDSQPGGYSKYVDYINEADRIQGRRKLVNEVYTGDANTTSTLSIEHEYDIFTLKELSEKNEIPLWLHKI